MARDVTLHGVQCFSGRNGEVAGCPCRFLHLLLLMQRSCYSTGPLKFRIEFEVECSMWLVWEKNTSRRISPLTYPKQRFTLLMKDIIICACRGLVALLVAATSVCMLVFLPSRLLKEPGHLVITRQSHAAFMTWAYSCMVPTLSEHSPRVIADLHCPQMHGRSVLMVVSSERHVLFQRPKFSQQCVRNFGLAMLFCYRHVFRSDGWPRGSVVAFKKTASMVFFV